MPIKKDETLNQIIQARIAEKEANTPKIHCPNCNSTHIMPKISAKGRSAICVACDFIFPTDFFKSK